MKIREVLEEFDMKMSMILADIMVRGVEEVLPKLCEAYKARGWSNWSVVNFAYELDLPDQDAIKIILISSRYAKNWTFS